MCPHCVLPGRKLTIMDTTRQRMRRMPEMTHACTGEGADAECGGCWGVCSLAAAAGFRDVAHRSCMLGAAGCREDRKCAAALLGAESRQADFWHLPLAPLASGNSAPYRPHLIVEMSWVKSWVFVPGATLTRWQQYAALQQEHRDAIRVLQSTIAAARAHSLQTAVLHGWRQQLAAGHAAATRAEMHAAQKCSR